MARDEKLVIRLVESVKEDFQAYSEELGMTMSALGSYVVGEWIRQQKNKERLEEKSALAMIEYGKKLLEEQEQEK
ncbi:MULTISPECIES: hypothetical protein [Terrabacteria group]|uniref:hypothetical protein n=1 Tax=Bacillati TaxID=1783272 RepID=UPI0035DC3AD5